MTKKKQAEKVEAVQEREPSGYLFFKNMDTDSVEQWMDTYAGPLSLIMQNKRKANSSWIGGVYVEYRPNVGEFDTTVPVE